MAKDEIQRTDFPNTDLWSALFGRKDKGFSDDTSTYPVHPSTFISPYVLAVILTSQLVIYTTPDSSSSYTYRQTLNTTIAFGTGLQHHFSFKKADVLALFCQNCIDTPAVTWGTHFVGGIVSPANPAYTVRELVHHLKDSGASILVTQKPLLKIALQAAKEAGIPKDRVLTIGEDRNPGSGVRHFSEILSEGGGVEDRVKVDPKIDLAFLVYSSGTTGLPKGVMLSHENVVADLYMAASVEGVLTRTGRDKVLSVLPFYHIYGMFELLILWCILFFFVALEGNVLTKVGLQCLVHLPIFLGVTSIVMPSFTLPEFCRIIQDHKITYTYVAPPVILYVYLLLSL
jgi:4-coumarate--CoA ligase